MIFDLHDKGRSIAEIARVTGLSQPQVSRALEAKKVGE
jgi:DNA-binding transcriptional ArsR family regulator